VQKGMGTRYHTHTKKGMWTPFPPHYTPGDNWRKLTLLRW